MWLQPLAFSTYCLHWPHYLQPRFFAIWIKSWSSWALLLIWSAFDSMQVLPWCQGMLHSKQCSCAHWMHLKWTVFSFSPLSKKKSQVGLGQSTTPAIYIFMLLVKKRMKRSYSSLSKTDYISEWATYKPHWSLMHLTGNLLSMIYWL